MISCFRPPFSAYDFSAVLERADTMEGAASRILSVVCSGKMSGLRRRSFLINGRKILGQKNRGTIQSADPVLK